MKEPLTKGDRVAVYGANQTGWDKIRFDRKLGTVEFNSSEGFVNVVIDGTDATATFHPKQCRRIRKPREFFVVLDRCGMASQVVNHEHAVKGNLVPGFTYVRVREVFAVKDTK